MLPFLGEDEPTFMACETSSRQTSGKEGSAIWLADQRSGIACTCVSEDKMGKQLFGH